MKRKTNYILAVIISFIFCISSALAEESNTCDYKTQALLNKAAFQVEANYTIKKGKDNVYYFEFSIYNLTDDIYAIITNDVTREELIVYNNMTKDNTYSFDVKDINTIINYTVSIKSLKDGCTDVFRKINVSKPRYNDLSKISMCEEDVMHDYSYCQEWVSRYFTETREEAIEKISNQYSKLTNEGTTECITCQNDEKIKEELKTKKLIRNAIIIGLIVGIVIDILLIVISIIKIRRNKYDKFI